MKPPEPGTDVTSDAWMLGIDTSTERAGLALGTGTTVRTRSWDAGRTQTTSVLPAIDALREEAAIRAADIAAVAVATGPGTFTGLRVGMGIAKGLVLALGIPLIGIPTLDVAASAVTGAECLAVLPAGRGRVVWQVYGSRATGTPRNTTVPELVEVLATMPGIVVAGEVPETYRELVTEAHPRVQWAHRSPERLLALARARWARGDTDDPETLEPRYVHGVAVSAGPVQDRLKRR